MAGATRIEWATDTWNPITGCDRIGPGCDNCYALRFAERWRGVPGHPYEQGFDLRLWPERLDVPKSWRKPRRVFVNSMSDLFHKAIPREYLDRVFDVMEEADRHVFQVLTKRSSLMRDYLQERYRDRSAPKHIWLGVSVEDAPRKSRIDHLREAPAGVRFLSVEPLLGSLGTIDLTGIHWVIVGGESGPGHRPMEADWAREVRDACDAQNVPFFFKQWGGIRPKSNGRTLDGRKHDAFPIADWEKASKRFEGKRYMSERSGTLLDELSSKGPERRKSLVQSKGSRYLWTPNSSLPTLDPHSLAKHDILARYVETYLRVMTSIPQKQAFHFTVVDGFCGGGEYALGRKSAFGSPLRVIQAVEAATARLHSEGRPNFQMKAVFHFVDEKRDHIEHLRTVLIREGYGSQIGVTIHLHTQRYEEAHDGIVREIQSRGRAHRSLFVLDQFGWSDVRLSTVRRILGELANAEVFLTFAVDALINFLSLNDANVQGLLNLDLNRSDVRELLDLKSQRGWRWLIQNGLYKKVQQRTGAPFYSPFFIHSPKGHRSYWFMHLSQHKQARQEIGELHWRLQNHFCHHGEAGFHTLGYDPSKDVGQHVLDYMFDDDARHRTMDAVFKEIPRLIHPAARAGRAVTMEQLFVQNCNDSPVTLAIATEQVRRLRDEGAVIVTDSDGRMRPRAKSLKWTDCIVVPEAPLLFSSIGWRERDQAA